MAMVVSPIYEILIYLEHHNRADLSVLSEKWGRNKAKGALGKMEAMGLVVIERSGDNKTARLSQKGYLFLNSILDAIHRGVLHWDGVWRFVWFSLPETARSKRDKFRRSLESLGFRPILSSVWASPLDYKTQVEKEANRLGIKGRFAVVESAQVRGLSDEEIVNAWDFAKFREHYEEFIATSQNIVASSHSQHIDSVKIKKKIFEYALILNSEPRIPIELCPKDWPKPRAALQYKKLRRLID